MTYNDLMGHLCLNKLRGFVFLMIAGAGALAIFSCSGARDSGGVEFDGCIRVSSVIDGVVDGRAWVGTVDGNSVLEDLCFVHQRVALAVADGEAVNFGGAIAFGGERLVGSGSIVFEPGQEPMYDRGEQGFRSYLMGYRPSGVLQDDVVTWAIDGATDILLTDLWDAGTYLNPVANGMIFRHILSQVTIKCVVASGASLDDARNTWGRITDIKLKSMPRNMTFNYSTNAVVATGGRSDFGLLKADFSGDFEAIDIPNSPDEVVARGMVPLTGGASFVLVVSTEKQRDAEVVISLSQGNTLQAGSSYVVSLIFDGRNGAIALGATQILGWNQGVSSLVPSVPRPKGPILEYGVAPYASKGAVDQGSRRESYYTLFGRVPDNGSYRGEPFDYADELPYHKFEIANSDIMTADGSASMGIQWDQAQVLGANAGAGARGNICAQSLGNGWRLPRLAELRLMFENRTALESVQGFRAFEMGFYWSATEFSVDHGWCVHFDATGNLTHHNKTQTSKVRCIKEITLPVIAEYGVAPFDITGQVNGGSTQESYNGLYGQGPLTNNPYQGNAPYDYSQELPFHRFEVARRDVSGGALMTWHWAMGADSPMLHGDVCGREMGPAWRVPRLSELRLMYENREKLARWSVDFEPFGQNYYWSATEANAGAAWFVYFVNGETTYYYKPNGASRVRCISEVE